MTDSELSSVRAGVDELIRAIPRLEGALQRNFENVNVTRHGQNTNHQLIITEIGNMKASLVDLARVCGAPGEILQSFGEAKAEAKGGLRMAQFLWPALVGLAGVVGGYLLRGV